MVKKKKWFTKHVKLMQYLNPDRKKQIFNSRNNGASNMELNKFRVFYTDFSGDYPKNRRKTVKAQDAFEAMDKVEKMNSAYSPYRVQYL